MIFRSVMPNLYSADVDRAAGFYRDLLGAAQTFRTPAEGPAGHVELRLGGVTIALSSREAVRRQGLPARSTVIRWSSWWGATRPTTRPPPCGPPGHRSWSTRTATPRAPPGLRPR